MHLNTHNLRNQQRGFPFQAYWRSVKMEKEEHFNVRVSMLVICPSMFLRLNFQFTCGNS